MKFTKGFNRKLYVAVFALLFVCASALISYAGENHEREYHDKDKHPEKERPFYPSMMTVKDGRQLKSSDFTDPEECGGCHSEIYEQWNGSMHSNAFVDPVFRALWQIGNKETGGLTEKLCSSCHTAIGVSSMEVGFSGGVVSDIAKKGVQCDVCHSITATNYDTTHADEPHNATFVLDPGDVKRGPFKDAESDFHETEYSELHTKSEFCANCHHVFHPLSNFPIERTYDEWKYSEYAAAGVQCQDCHMVPVALLAKTAAEMKPQKNPGTAVDGGPMREHIYTHEFVGGNFTVTALLGADKHADIAKQRLKLAAKVEVTTPGITKGFGTVNVKVTNIAAGHNLPTSLTEVRQMWLDVTVKDKESGKVLFSTGKIDKDGNIEPDSVIFNATAVDKDGHHTAKPWEIVRFDYNKTIPPKGYALEKFSFPVPDGVKEVTVETKLRYRSFSQALANLLLGKDAPPVVPVVDMNIVTSGFPVEG